TADPVQGAALRRDRRRAPVHTDRPHREAPPRPCSHPGRGRFRSPGGQVTGNEDWARTWIGGATPDAMTVAGRDLPSGIMGRVTLTELTYLLVTRRDPTDSERQMLDAVLVSLADHGLTPSALAARLTYTG